MYSQDAKAGKKIAAKRRKKRKKEEKENLTQSRKAKTNRR
jgi:hypothetical protein